jgi:urocanate hydratase
MGVSSLDVSMLPTGLCTLTGFISSGSFHSIGAHVVISGTYTTVWDIPAVAFGVVIPPPFGGSTITGTVTRTS